MWQLLLVPYFISWTEKTEKDRIFYRISIGTLSKYLHWLQDFSAKFSTKSFSVNPIRPDPFEFLIGLSVCLWDTHSLTTIWNELEGCNFACRFDFTHFEDPSIQIWKVDHFKIRAWFINLYQSPKCYYYLLWK